MQVLNKSIKYVPLPEPYESLFRIQRALAGHISYLAACDSNIVFTEYLLYEPILRVLRTREYEVECEFSCADFLKKEGKQGGDHLRIDFVTKKADVHFALEVKWPRTEARTLNVQGDFEKLAGFRKKYAGAQGFLCVFGRFTLLQMMNLSPNSFAPITFKNTQGKEQQLEDVFAFFTRTQFGCRMFQLEVGEEAYAVPAVELQSGSKPASLR